MSNPDGVLSLSLRLGATLCANGLTVAARVADPLLNMFGPIDRRAKRFLTLDGCDHADRLTAAEEKVDVLDPFWSDGGPTEWLGVAPSGQPTDFDGPVGEYPEIGRAQHPLYRQLQDQVDAETPCGSGERPGLVADPNPGQPFNTLPNWQAPQSSAPGILRQQQPVERDAPSSASPPGAGSGSGVAVTTRGERGFSQYGEPVKTDYGDLVEVYESSAASARYCWLRVYDDGTSVTAKTVGEMTAHLTVDQASAIRARLDAFIADAPLTPIGEEQPVSVGVTGPGADGATYDCPLAGWGWKCTPACGRTEETCLCLHPELRPVSAGADFHVIPPATSADQTTSALMAAAAHQLFSLAFRAGMAGIEYPEEFVGELIDDLRGRAAQHEQAGD